MYIHCIYTPNTPLNTPIYALIYAFKQPINQVPLAVGCGAGMVIFFMSKKDVLPKWHMALVLLAFLSCIAWLDLIGNECVAVRKPIIVYPLYTFITICTPMYTSCIHQTHL